MKPVTRIAPSPTGFLHVGTAHTALYNWLFARKHGGKFILRIEDTDIKRSDSAMSDVIIESLKWLGLEWDEGPYFQSDKFPVYKKYAKELLQNKSAYYCYCTPKELEERKKEAISQKKTRKYDRKCFNLSDAEKKRFENRPKAIRFFIPDGKVSFEDGLHNKVERDSQDIEDFVILKSDGTPSYNLACVVDDHELGITNVIRGEDHLVNTFKQILLYKAFGWKPPEFVHHPMILGTDRSKLSKRHGAVSVLDYKKQGILPEALVNFLALLGWSPGDDREIMSREELIDLFSLDRLSLTASVFDIKKLEWMNGEYIKKLSDEELLDRILALTVNCQLLTVNKEYMLKIVNILKPRMQRLTDFGKFSGYFFEDPTQYESEGVDKYFKLPEVQRRLTLVKDRFSELKEFNVEAIESAIRELASELGIKAALLIHPIRLALTGKTGGPSLFHIVEILGKEAVIRRLKKALLFLKELK
ncbi:glutamate--tRNA ligase [candidate division WOR-3 bacterium]|nr:glutamate--tRNA ligase [candidate division WOR-3 bacterium]